MIRLARWWGFPPWQLALAVVVSFAIGWQLEECRHLPDPQPAIVPARLP